MYFADRREAGARLGDELAARLAAADAAAAAADDAGAGGGAAARAPPLVLALPRGGVPVAEAVARRLGAPLEVFVVRKIGAPIHPEYAIGAIAEGGTMRLDAEAAAMVRASKRDIEEVVARESRELARRVQLYRGGRPLPPLGARTVVVVDDGLATGMTAEAACRALRAAGARRVVLATPVGSPSTVRRLAAEGVADEVVCLSQPPAFHAVGQFYYDFTQTTDDEVMAILADHRCAHPPPLAAPAAASETHTGTPAGAAAGSAGEASPQAPAEGANVELVAATSGPAAGDDVIRSLLPDPGPEPDYRSPAVGVLGSTAAAAAAAGAPARDAAPRGAGGDQAAAPAAAKDGGPAGREDARGAGAGAGAGGSDQAVAAAAAARRIAGGLRKEMSGPAPAAAVTPPLAAAPAGDALVLALTPPAGAAPTPVRPRVIAPAEREVTVRIPSAGTAGAGGGVVGGAASVVALPGTLTVPEGATGVVLFAHGSGSGRLSPRNRLVAGALNNAGVATLLFDLLTDRESSDRHNVFDIRLLASRLEGALAWLRADLPALGLGEQLPVGFFGASTGGGAALWAAADLGPRVAAVVSRGGRPDLAADRLPQVAAPTLLLVGGDDEVVLELNESAARCMTGAAEVEVGVIHGATHLFPEPGALEAVATKAAEWFARHFAELAPVE